MTGETSDANWLAPWVTIWTSPRATIRRIVDTDPGKFAVGIAWVAGALGALDFEISAQRTQTGGAVMARWLDSIGALGFAAFACILGLFGVAMLFFLGRPYRWSGEILGGTAQSVEVRAAIAWAQVPAIYITVLGVVAAIIASPEPAPTAPFPLWSLVRGILGVWALVISLKTLAEVHRFSAWRGLGTVLLGGLAIFAIILGALIAIMVIAVIAHRPFRF